MDGLMGRWTDRSMDDGGRIAHRQAVCGWCTKPADWIGNARQGITQPLTAHQDGPEPDALARLLLEHGVKVLWLHACGAGRFETTGYDGGRQVRSAAANHAQNACRWKQQHADHQLPQTCVPLPCSMAAELCWDGTSQGAHLVEVGRSDAQRRVQSSALRAAWRVYTASCLLQPHHSKQKV
eukprot:284920-Chlamydomonas_euryale.AAC.11